MKKYNAVFALLVVALCLLAGGRAEAQFSDWSLSVSNNPSGTVSPNTQITYVINVTNLTGSVLSTTVTDNFPATANLISATNNLGATISNNIPGQVTVSVPGFSTVPLQITLVLAPTASGFFTNTIAVGSPIDTTLPIVSTNIVTQVIPLTTTLNASVILPTNAVLANDWVTYTLTVTNPGANSATSVVLSNTLPTGAILISPTNPAPTNGVMVFNLGTLASKASQTFAITIQPTVVGTNVFLDSLSSSRSTTVMITNSLTVAPFDTTQLAVANLSTMYYDPQDGLMEQTIQVTNISTNTISGLRVVVSGLTNVPIIPNRILYNAVGTNNGNPFVEYDFTLATNQSTNLVLEYDPMTRTDMMISNSQYAAVPVSPPTNSLASGTPLAITNIIKLPSGNIMIEFSATKGGTYVIQYTDNFAMTNWMQAQPPIVAPANEVQWIDFGPPETISTPATANPRFYQVIQTH